MGEIGYGLISTSIGLLAGFQGIYDRFHADWPRAIKTLPGVLYLLSRGLAATLTYFGASALGIWPAHLVTRALACGAATEAVLRSRFYALRVKKAEGSYEEWVKGPLDLWQSFQNLFLATIDDRISLESIPPVETISEHFASFEAMLHAFDQRILAWDERRTDVAQLKKEVAKLRTECTAATHSASSEDLSTIDHKFRLKLCYLVENWGGRERLEKLFLKR